MMMAIPRCSYEAIPRDRQTIRDLLCCKCACQRDVHFDLDGRRIYRFLASLEGLQDSAKCDSRLARSSGRHSEEVGRLVRDDIETTDLIKHKTKALLRQSKRAVGVRHSASMHQSEITIFAPETCREDSPSPR